MTAIANDSTGLVWCPHPLQPALDRRFVAIDWRRGDTIQDILDRSGIDPHSLVSVTWNDRLLTVAEWQTILPQPNDLLLVRAECAGGKGGSNPLQAVLMVALMVVGNVFGAALGASMFGTTGVMAAEFGGVALSTILGRAVISIAGNLLLGAMFSPAKGSSSSVGAQGATASPSYALTGGSNSMRPFAPMPVVLGCHRIFPDLAAASYTDYVGDDQYLYQIFHFGLSDIVLDDFRIGETPISSYSDVTFHWPDATGVMKDFPGNVDTASGAEITQAAGWVSRTSGRDANVLALDLEGSFYASSSKGLVSISADFEIEYRRAGSTDWEPFCVVDVIVWGKAYWSLGHWQSGQQSSFYSRESGSNGGPDGHSTWIQTAFGGTDAAEHHEGDLGPRSSRFGDAGSQDIWRYRPYSEILTKGDGSALREPAPPQPSTATKISRLTLSGSSTKPLRRTIRATVSPGQYDVRIRRTSADETDAQRSSRLNWVSLKTFQPDRMAYPGQNRLGLVIKASGQLNGTIQQFSATATQRVSYYEDGQWKYGASTNPAWIFLNFCLGRRSDDGTELYGCFLSDDLIDWDAIIAWAAFCDKFALSCSMVIDQPTLAGDVLDDIARCGLASVSRASGRVGVVWDAPNTPVTGCFGMANIVKGSYSIEYVNEDLADEIVVTFVNRDKGWVQDQVRVMCPGVTAPTASTTVPLTGCTNEKMAGLYANYLAAQQHYRCRRVTWMADFESLTCQRGDVILNSHDLAQWGYSGRLVGVSGKVVTLDRAVSAEIGSQSLWIVRPDGKIIEGITTLPVAGSYDTLMLTTAPALQDAMSPIDHKWFFGPLGTPGKKLRIIDIQPQPSLGQARIIATDEFAEFYSAWHGTWSRAPESSLLKGAPPAVTQVSFSESVLTGGDIQVQILLQTTGAFDHARVSYFVDDHLIRDSRIDGRADTITCPRQSVLRLVLLPIGPRGETGQQTVSEHVVGAKDGSSGTTTVPAASNGASVTVDTLGYAGITFDGWSDPQIVDYEMRVGESFEAGVAVATSSTRRFVLPLISSAGNIYWIRGRYQSGGYTTLQYKIDFSGQNLEAPTNLSWSIAEPAIKFAWSAVPAAAQYIALFEDGGVTTIRTVATPEASFLIPKWSSVIRVIAMAADGTLSKYVDMDVGVDGHYHYNELLNVALPLTTGNFINLAFTEDDTIKRASLLGLTPVAPYAQNINDGDLYTFGYNLVTVPAAALVNTPANWFREGFWRISTGFFESGVVDLGDVYTGKLALNLTKSVNYVGAAPVSAYGHVAAVNMADATVQELIDEKAFLAARFLVTANNPGDPGWVDAANGDWVKARYVKIVVEVAMASPLTEITVTAGAITIDVPDVSETGTVSGVTSAGKYVAFTKSYHNVSVVLATARGAAKAWVTGVTKEGCTIWVDSGSQQVDYFAKGY